MSSCERMSKDQVARLALAICATAEIIGHTLTSDAALIMADDLASYKPDDVANALKACRRELNGKLTLASILQRVQASDGRPARDEAWSIALSASDEYDTVVMTDEIQLALSAARPVLDAGDLIGARMAFMSAYDRLILQARSEAAPVKWNVSVGFDAGRRIAAVTAAVQMQRIPQERGQLLLADLTHEPISEDGQAIAGLLTGPDVKRASPVMRQRLQRIKEQMKEMSAASEARRLDMKIHAANALARRVALLAAQAQNHRRETESTEG